MDFLCLLGSSGLAGSDGPYRLVSDDDVLHILSAEVVEDILNLCGANVEMLAGLSFLEVLTYAEDDLERVGKCKFGLFNEFLVGLTIILATLGVSENGIGSTSGSNHCGADFAGVCSLLLVCAVLCRKSDYAALYYICNRNEVGCRSCDDELDI